MPFYPPFSIPFYFNNNHYPQSPHNLRSNIKFTSGYKHTNSNANYTPSYNNSNSSNYTIHTNSSCHNPNESSHDNSQNKKKTTESFEDSDAFFEIFGLKLYFDDILIICILFFLYTEKVHDDELFICLILLLLS